MNNFKTGDLVGNALFAVKKNFIAPPQLTQLGFPFLIGQQNAPTFKVSSTDNVEFCIGKDLEFNFSKKGILVEEKKIVYGYIKTEENITLPLSVNCWSVFIDCEKKMEYWRTEDLVKL